jgi:hypothetical protein
LKELLIPKGTNDDGPVQVVDVNWLKYYIYFIQEIFFILTILKMAIVLKIYKELVVMQDYNQRLKQILM